MKLNNSFNTALHPTPPCSCPYPADEEKLVQNSESWLNIQVMGLTLYMYTPPP